MKHTSILLAAAMCALAASSTFTPALAQEIRTLEIKTIGEADNTGRRLRLVRLTRRTITAQTGAVVGTPMQDDFRRCRRPHELAHTTSKNSAWQHIPYEETQHCRRYEPAVH